MELLVVIAIIGILVAIVLADYTTAQEKSRDARRVTDMKEVQNAWEQYYADNNATYPSPVCSISTSYLPAGFPDDPRTGQTYVSMHSGWSSCSASMYCFCAGMELSGTEANSGVDCYGVTTPGYTHGFYCVHTLQ